MSEFGNYQDFPFAVECYDYIPFNVALDDIDFFLKYAAEVRGAVLDLGCGTGRVLIPIARQGSDITGLDVSPLMLEACRTKLERLPAPARERVTLVEASMHDFKLSEKFGLIFSAFRSFQVLLNVEDQLACLRCLSDHLQDDGRLILGVFDPHLPFLVEESRKEEWGRDAPFSLPDGRTVELRQRNPVINLTRQVIECELIYYVTHPNGHKERLVQSFPLRYFFRYEMEHLLARAGFEIINLFGGYDHAPFGTKRPQEIVVIAHKRH